MHHSLHLKETVYVIYGVKNDNISALLLLEVNPSESSSVWGEHLEKLRKRGVERIDLIVADGLPNFAKKAKNHYPEADIQRCVVHLQRNILNKIRLRDKQAFALDLKHLFDNFDEKSTKPEVFRKIMELKNKWRGMYDKVLEKLSEERIQDYFTYIKYLPEVKRMIYTTN